VLDWLPLSLSVPLSISFRLSFPSLSLSLCPLSWGTRERANARTHSRTHVCPRDARIYVRTHGRTTAAAAAAAAAVAAPAPAAAAAAAAATAATAAAAAAVHGGSGISVRALSGDRTCFGRVRPSYYIPRPKRESKVAGT